MSRHLPLKVRDLRAVRLRAAASGDARLQADLRLVDAHPV
jgi:hypothetical protein